MYKHVLVGESVAVSLIRSHLAMEILLRTSPDEGDKPRTNYEPNYYHYFFIKFTSSVEVVCITVLYNIILVLQSCIYTVLHENLGEASIICYIECLMIRQQLKIRVNF